MTPPINNMIAQGQLTAGIFAFYLNRVANGVPGGELSIGGVDHDRFEGTSFVDMRILHRKNCKTFREGTK